MALELSRATGPPMLVNRDAHFGNVLSARREPWLLIDPKPLAGDPAPSVSRTVRALLDRSAPRASA